MKKYIYLLFLLNNALLVLSQNYQINWQQCFGGTESDKSNDLVEINNELYILGGTGSNDGDVSYNHGQGDVWLVKTDSIGNIIWEKTYGGSSGELGHRIIVNNDNGFYILARTGSSDGDISYNPFPGTTCFWILKIDFDGNIVWEKVIGGNGADEMVTGTLTDDGGILALGYSGSEFGDVTINYGLYDIWMIKLNSDGEIEWDFTLGTDWQDYGDAIIQTSDGGFLIGGTSKLTGGGNLDCDCNGQADGVLVKLDIDRNIEWQQCYGGSDYDAITAIIQIEDGYIFGAYVQSNDGDISGWHGEHDIWIVKIDHFGNIIWQKCLGGTNSEFVSDLLIINEQNLLISGVTYSNDGDVSGNHSSSEYYHDVWIVKLSGEGEFLSQQCFGGERKESLYFGIGKKSDNNFVIAGRTNYGPSYDVACTPHGGNNDDEFWVFEIQDTTTNIINQIQKKNSFNVAPNPASQWAVFNFTLTDNETDGLIKITDVTGKIVESFIVNGLQGQKVWDTRSINSGVYLYTFTSNGFSKSGKIVINK